MKVIMFVTHDHFLLLCSSQVLENMKYAYDYSWHDNITFTHFLSLSYYAFATLICSWIIISIFIWEKIKFRKNKLVGKRENSLLLLRVYLCETTNCLGLCGHFIVVRIFWNVVRVRRVFRIDLRLVCKLLSSMELRNVFNPVIWPLDQSETRFYLHGQFYKKKIRADKCIPISNVRCLHQ